MKNKDSPRPLSAEAFPTTWTFEEMLAHNEAKGNVLAPVFRVLYRRILALEAEVAALKGKTQ